MSSAASAAKAKAATSSPQASYISGAVVAADGGRNATPGHLEYSVEPPSAAMPRLHFTTVPEGN